MSSANNKDSNTLGNLNKNQRKTESSSLFPTDASTITSIKDHQNSSDRLPLSSNSFVHNMNYGSNHKYRNYKYRLWQCRIYNYLERPRGWKSGIYHILM